MARRRREQLGSPGGPKGAGSTMRSASWLAISSESECRPPAIACFYTLHSYALGIGKHPGGFCYSLKSPTLGDFLSAGGRRSDFLSFLSRLEFTFTSNSMPRMQRVRSVRLASTRFCLSASSWDCRSKIPRS